MPDESLLTCDNSNHSSSIDGESFGALGLKSNLAPLIKIVKKADSGNDLRGKSVESRGSNNRRKNLNQ
jgi:hypothetical protein